MRGGAMGGLMRPALLACLCSSLFSLSGCAETMTVDKGANQSLVEIGERSLEEAESLENRGLTRDANIAYRRALWAFRYHEKLTGEQPFLLDEALDGTKRTVGNDGARNR